MSAFQYFAIDIKGKKQKGIIEADSSKQARQLLREQGLTPLTVDLAQQKITTLKIKTGKRPTLSSKELALITRQLATLVNASLPITDVLLAVGEQIEKPRTKGLILAMRGKVLEGHTLAAACRDYPHVFSELYCSTIAAGEKSGHLGVVLQRLADYIEQQLQMKQKIQQACIYPSIMMLVAIGIVGFLLEYVVPKMVAVYSNTGQSLPTLTAYLISFSNGLKDYGIYGFLMIMGIILICRNKLKTNKAFRHAVHRLLLRVPILGNAITTSNTARFSRTFAILSSAGVVALDAMHIASKLITNVPIRIAVEDAAKRVKEGANIHLALKHTTYFAPMSIHLIASGEASGQLEPMLEHVANNQDSEITRLIETGLTLFEPAIILLMGGVILLIVLAVMLPIFQLNQLTG